MEKLTIQHISPYTLSKLKFKIDKRSKEEFEMIEVGQNYVTLHHEEYGTKRYFLSTNIYSPVLYPISCLTKTIQHEGREFIPILELAKLSYPRLNWFIKDRDWGDGKMMAYAGNQINCCIQFYYDANKLRFDDNYLSTCEQYQLFQKLAEWHINFVGIPEGLYIDKNTLK